MRRIEKLALLTSILTGTATPKQIVDLRKSGEPIYLTLNLDDELTPYDPDEPTYHIDVYNDGTTRCYDRYPDGRVEYRNN
ncbi:hypothetical protein [Spirosoma jeollabukense]